MTASATGSDRPTLSFDLDGVLARPPFGRNPTANRDTSLLPMPGLPPVRRAPPGNVWDRLLGMTYFRLRYRARSAMPGAADLVRAAAVRHRVVVITARNWRGRNATSAWLQRAGLSDHIDELICNDTGLPAPQFKAWAVAEHGVQRHVEDDPATAALVARLDVAVDLIDWPWNRELDYPPAVTRQANLSALAADLRRPQ
jgi:hypothetical protein